MRYALTWAEASEAGPLRAGGKGWNLGRLHRYGFPVPPGAVLTAEAYREHLAGCGVAASLPLTGIDDVTAPDAAARLEAVRAAIAAAPLPAPVRETALALAAGLRFPLAVRSSATGEDGAAASFAGIHRTYLQVTDEAALLEAVKGCYASLWTPAAVAYRRRLGLDDREVAAAVVIQEMVPAGAAGVAFSCDPLTGRLDRFVINANRGLGESVVSGEAEPDEYRVSPATYPPPILSVRVGRKRRVTLPREGGGTETVEAAPSGRVLSDGQVRELTLLIGRVHDALGNLTEPQDIEWAHDGSRFYVLQSRPVTRLPEPRLPGAEQFPTYWSNANLRDVMPLVQTPLGWTMVRHQVEILLRTPFVQAGFRLPAGLPWIRLIRGRAYFNLTLMQWGFYDALGILPAETNRILGGHQPAIPVSDPPYRGVTGLRRLARAARAAVGGTLVLRRAPRTFASWTAWLRQMESVDPGALSRAELTRLMDDLHRRSLEWLPVFQSLNGSAGAGLQSLLRLLEPAFGERANALANGLLAGRSKLTSAEQGRRLIELGNLALREERVAAWFRSVQWRAADWREALSGTRWRAAFAAYLDEYGHRGVYELEIANPRWREDPTYLLQAVGAQVLEGRAIEPEDPGARRRAAETEVYAKMGRRTPRGIAVRWAVDFAARAAEGRETGKSLIVWVVSLTRRAVLEVGRRMAADGLIRQADDVFFLSAADLMTYLDGGETGSPKQLVADRRRQHEAWQAEDAPDVIEGETPVPPVGPAAQGWASLRGLGVASGRASGPACVVRHPHEGARLRQGDVLVAPSTDPAWTPLFLRASALVMEVGGYLSHGSIVAREYGIPAVVNVPGAMGALQDGERLIVDGDTGTVTRA
jgi:rifampicin phosphotransferase